MEIRLTTDGDLPAIRDILNREIAENFAHFGTAPETTESVRAQWAAAPDLVRWVTAHTGSEVMGFARGGPWKRREAYRWSAEVSVYVSPAYHRRGVGRALYARLFDELKRAGYRRLIGGIALPNKASVRLHESMGMRKVAHFERTGFKMGRWIDVAYWQIDVGHEAQPIEPPADALDT
ncbi:MAG: N-acetyltransferase family protein [Planctomycetota bacterium]